MSIIDRDALALRVSETLSGRPVRWAKNVVGDYDGRDRTLEVFNADPREQRELLRKFRLLRKEMETAVGGPVIVIFHTREESARLYSDFVTKALADEVTGDVVQAQRTFASLVSVLQAAPGIDRPLHTRATVPGTGSTALPRRAA